MSTAHRIANAVSPYPKGDVEKYFEHLDAMIELNSGNNDYKMVSHDAYAVSAPIPENGNTKFRITDSSMDIVDISQGYIDLKCKMNLEFKALNSDGTNVAADATNPDSKYRNLVWFFVGFKSGSHIINIYNVYSNGRLTACKQTKAKHEQTITYNCKAKEERAGRPGMYSVHEDVLKMRDCVCGVYVQQPAWTDFGKTNGVEIEFNVLVQIDDLLPFSAMSYFPRFAVGDLELELSCDLSKNMVFCPIPLSEVLQSSYGLRTFNSCVTDAETRPKLGCETEALSKYSDVHRYTKAESLSDIIVDSRFTQCGDYARCLLGIKQNGATQTDSKNITYTTNAAPNSITGTAITFTDEARDVLQPKDCYVTIVPHNLTITKARSYVFGFNIKEAAKENLKKIFYEQDTLTIPAQWCEHSTFPQNINGNDISENTIMSLYECGQLILTFPSTANQLTVTRNPHLNKIRCQIGDRMIPDKDMNTADDSHAEMIITGLGLDSLFTADKSLINSLKIDKDLKNTDWVMRREDDSDYMYVCDLTRNGAMVYNDGLTSNNCSVTFTASLMHGVDNPHYNALNLGAGDKLAFTAGTNAATITPGGRHKNSTNPNIFLIEDAYWVCGADGIEFIKDSTTISLTTQREARIREAHQTAIDEAMIERRAVSDNYKPFQSPYKR